MGHIIIAVTMCFFFHPGFFHEFAQHVNFHVFFFPTWLTWIRWSKLLSKHTWRLWKPIRLLESRVDAWILLARPGLGIVESGAQRFREVCWWTKIFKLDFFVFYRVVFGGFRNLAIQLDHKVMNNISTGWWQLKTYFFKQFHPENWGRWRPTHFWRSHILKKGSSNWANLRID